MTRFSEFWPRYLRAHQHRGTHATTIALSAVAASVFLHAVWLTLFGIIVGYGIALASHRIGDRSKSLVFVNPVCWLALTGGLSAELARHVGAARNHAAATMIQSSQ